MQKEKEKWLHRSVSRATVSLLKRRSPNVRATPWPTREVPTSFLLQFKRALPPVLPEEMSAIVDGIGHTEKSLSSIWIISSLRAAESSGNGILWHATHLYSVPRLTLKFDFTGIRRGVWISKREERRAVFSDRYAIAYTIYFAGESAAETRVSRTMKKVENKRLSFKPTYIKGKSRPERVVGNADALSRRNEDPYGQKRRNRASSCELDIAISAIRADRILYEGRARRSYRDMFLGTMIQAGIAISRSRNIFVTAYIACPTTELF